MYHTWLSVGDFDTPHLPFQTYHPGRDLFSHLAHFWWPTPSPVLPECYCSRRCLSLLPLFAFMKTPQRHNGNWCKALRTKWHLYKVSPKSHGNKCGVWCTERGAAADAAIRNSSSALIRTQCHQVRCWKDVECVKPFPGSFNNHNVHTNGVNTKTRWPREVFCEVIIYISLVLHDGDIDYQFLLDVLVSLLQNVLCPLQNCIFCFELSNFLSFLLVHSPLAAQFPHQTFQL